MKNFPDRLTEKAAEAFFSALKKRFYAALAHSRKGPRSGDIKALPLTVYFFQDERKVEYQREQITELEMAYAIMIHKSQGSEFEVVILPVLTQHYRMLFRNLIYTGIMRARKLAFLSAPAAPWPFRWQTRKQGCVRLLSESCCRQAEVSVKLMNSIRVNSLS